MCLASGWVFGLDEANGLSGGSFLNLLEKIENLLINGNDRGHVSGISVQSADLLA
jgi:hypothetical protein